MIEIERLETALKKLNQIEYDSRWPIHDKENGRNQKLRDKAQRDLEHQIDIAKYVIKEFDLLALKLGEDRNEMDKAMWMAEFPKYFPDDIKEFIRLIKEQITNLKDRIDGMD